MKSKTKRAKKLSLSKTTIQNINNQEIQDVRAGADANSVKPGYPCVYDPVVGKYISEPGYGTTCPPAPAEPVDCRATCHCLN